MSFRRTDRRLTRIVLAIVVATGAVILQSPAPGQAAMAVQRIGGADRYATAAAVSAAHVAPGVPVVLVATGSDFPDALAGGPAAARAGGPILLVTRDAVPPATAAELTRLAPGRIVVLGGPAAVGDDVLTALDAYDTGGGVARIGGEDRFATAAAVSAANFAPGLPMAFVATGATFPDALVGGVAAARMGGPVLLTRIDALPASTEAELRRLAPAQIVVLGGTGAVSDAVVAALQGLAMSGGVTRLGGADRYATAVAVSAAMFPTGGPLFVATGRSFPDALVAVPAAALSGAGLLLVPGSSLPAAVGAEAARLQPARLVLLGGHAVLNDRVTFDLRVALGDLRPLPACEYLDIATPLQGYDDWQRTLVDTVLMVPPTYVPPDLVDSSQAGLNGGYLMRGLVVADLAAMAGAARAAGGPIQLVSGYRSYETQQATFDHWVSVGGYEAALRTSARPGHSEHQLGTTLDFTSQGGRPPWEYADWGLTPAGAWIRANAWQYGFVMSYLPNSFGTVCYDYESWHYRYLGRDVAWQVHVSGLSLREWLWLNGSGG